MGSRHFSVQAVYEKYQDKGLHVIGVNNTNDDSIYDVREFVSNHGWTFPVILDESGTVSD